MTHCEGCQFEMYEAYLYQKNGFDAGLNWATDKRNGKEHCFVFVLDKNGEFIIE